MRIRAWWKILAVALSCLTQPAWAEDKDPLEAALEACLGTNQGMTTAGMVECTGTAVAAWDQRLNEVYRNAIRTLDPKSRDLLRTSQRQWLAFREAEHALQRGPWGGSRGSLGRVEIMAADLSAIKERVSELTIYAPGN